MFKKLFIVALAVAGGMFILHSTHLGGYARTAWSKVKNSAKKQVPLEFQIESIKNEITQLTPDMRRHISAIAAETVQVQNLQDEITTIAAKLEKEKDSIRELADMVRNSDTKPVNFRGRLRSSESVHQDLAIKVDGAKQCAESLKTKQQLLEAKERTLAAEKAKLESMRHLKEQLTVQVTQMEAELKTMRLAQTRSEFALDDSRLSRIKEQMAELRNQIKVVQEEGNLLAAFDNDVAPADKKVKTHSQIVKEANEFLGNGDVAKAPEGK